MIRAPAAIPPKTSKLIPFNAPPPPPELLAVTVKVAEEGEELTVPLLQVSVYVKLPVVVGVTVWLPLAASEPVQLPEAVQLVALVEVQLRVAVLPETMELADAVKVAVGAGAVTSSVTVVAAEFPFAFAHTSVYV